MQTALVFLLACVALAVSPIAATSCDTKGATIEKSFFQSVHDCVEYLQIPKERLLQYLSSDFPPDDETKCLIYCVGVDLRWWNNTCGLQLPPIVSYFQPVHGDTGYEKRTKECLDRRVGAIQSPNNCCQAYETFQCYFQEFGNLVTCPQYVPLTKLQATQVALDCLVVLRYPEELLKVYASGKVEDSPETRCLYLCIDQRSGLYTHEDGILPHRFFVRDAAYNDLRYLCKETKACRDRIRNSGCDPCTEAYTTHVECLTGLGEDGYTSGIITQAAKIALTNLGIPCVHPEPTCPVCEAHHHSSVYPVEPHYPEITYEQPHYPSPKLSCSACGKKYHHRPACGCAERPKPQPTPEPVCSRCHKTPVYNKPFRTGYIHSYKPAYH